MRKIQLTGIAAGLIFAVGFGSGCGHSAEKIGEEADVISGIEEAIVIVSDEEPGNDGTEIADLQTRAENQEALGLMEQLAGSSWRLAYSKTEEHLKQYDSLQEMWGTGIHYGSGMEIGTDGSFEFYIAVNYGGTGTVTEQGRTLVAEITPYGLEWGEDTAGAPERLVITPAEEDGVLYLTTPCDKENMYWEQLESSCSFADFSNIRFCFSSGAGAWSTILDIAADGSFSGEYQDGNMGERNENYPNGEQDRCDFSGKFTEPEKINAYTYSMKIMELSYEKEPGTEEIKDGILYRYSDAYGLAGAENILIYLPGTPVAELPEEFRKWAYYPDLSANLPLYGLYNETQGYGFSSYQRTPVNDGQLASRLVEDQYFDVYLDGWDEVTFAAFRPDLSANPGGDAEFMLLRDGEVLYRFPGYNQENKVTGQPFQDVQAVAFRDVDRDGSNDILIINEYGTDAEHVYLSVRVYSSPEGERGFVIDKYALMDEFLNENHYNDSIADVEEGIEAYWEY